VSAKLRFALRSVPPEDRVRDDPGDGPSTHGRSGSADAEDTPEPSPDDWSVQQPKQLPLMQQEEQAAEGPPILIFIDRQPPIPT
jgi:hypothetical protein